MSAPQPQSSQILQLSLSTLQASHNCIHHLVPPHDWYQLTGKMHKSLEAFVVIQLKGLICLDSDLTPNTVVFPFLAHYKEAVDTAPQNKNSHAICSHKAGTKLGHVAVLSHLIPSGPLRIGGVTPILQIVKGSPSEVKQATQAHTASIEW